MSRTPWYDNDNPSTVVRGATWRGIVWVLAVLAVVGAVGIGVWGFRVATSDVKGQGDAVIQKNDATNRIAAQERFEDLYAEIIAADQKIAPARQAYRNDKTQVNLANLTGLQNYCLDVVADYNAEARKYKSADFRAIDLPQEINLSNSATDCK